MQTHAVAAMSDAPSPMVNLGLTMVRRARGGDQVAFRWLFDRDAKHVHRFLVDLLHDRDAADEATQETFVRAHRNMAELREVERWRSWLFGTARLVSLEQHRRVRRAPKDSLDDVPHPPDRAPDPESALLGREADRLLDGALQTLSDERRAALLLRLDHGLDYDAIADAMSWTASKVKNELHRARLELRAHLGTYGEA